MSGSKDRFWHRIGNPLNAQRMKRLAARWQDYPEHLKTPTQAIGRYAVACGATHGIHEACNFGCTACYLGKDANKQKPMSLDEAKQQLDQLADYLGPGGNVQITSGEVTLLPVDHLCQIVAHAKTLGLSPMVMSHGDVLLHDPDYLDKLVVEGGLRKLSLHVDITQRGRKGISRPRSEQELTTTRLQMAHMLRQCRKRTGVKLKTATTLTVNRDNLDELGTVMETFLGNLDCFRVISFQPQAATGRTPDGDVQPDAELVWGTLEQALGMELNPHAFQFGHRSCNRIALVLAVETGKEVHYLQAVRPNHSMDSTFLSAFLKDFGGVDINDRPLLQVIAPLLGVALHKPVWFWRMGAYAFKRTWQERRYWFSCLSALLKGRLRLRPFGIVVHTFMSEDELKSDLGRERLAACTFKVAVDGRMVSMCEMNATPLRESTYSQTLTSLEV